jgi:GDP-mannose transporter
MIFTSAKALQYISIPTYTIFKNLTIILIAYGEVLWFGGSVTGLALLSFGLMVLSSIVSAWADISAAISTYAAAPHEAATELATLNAGYIWMLLNCLSSATFVLSMRKRIKLTQFSDFDSPQILLIIELMLAMFYNNLISIPILVVASFAFEDWGTANLEQNLYIALYAFMIDFC